MKNTVVILNEVMASMTLAFKRAGFDIVTSYENDAKMCDIYKCDIESNLIEESIFKTDIVDIPDADVMMGKLVGSVFLTPGIVRDQKRYKGSFDMFYSIFSLKHPKVFVLEGSKAMSQREEFPKFLSDLVQEGYRISYKVYDVHNLTGLPVNEKKLYIIGVRTDIEKEYTLLEKESMPLYSSKDILEKGHIDEWYYDIKSDVLTLYENINIDNESFLCWTPKGYLEKEKVSWNFTHIPLVNFYGKIRRLTHREVARLKGYPDDFDLKINTSNKLCLYKQLMNASNIYLVYQIAKSIEYVLNDNYIRNQQVARTIKFEKLVGQYLREKFDTVRTLDKSDIWGDFQVDKRGNSIHIAVKIYTNKKIEHGGILGICQQLSVKNLDTQDSFILIVGNIVEKGIKQKCKDEDGIFIWDIANVLFFI